MEDLATANVKELTPGAVKAAMAGVQSQDLWQVEPDNVKIIPGYNPRPLNKERVRWLADRMIANGYDRKQPLGGYIAKDGVEDVYFLTAGHHRHAAVQLAISEGAPIEKVPMVSGPRGAGMAEITLELITSNEGNPLTTYEKAIVCKRLAAFDWDSATIAAKAGFASAQYVDDLLLLAAAPLAVRRMVMEDAVSATAAIAAIKKHGEKAHEVLAAALVKSGGKKATPKHMPDAAFNKAVKKQARPMFDALQKVTADPVFSAMSDELREAVIAILEGLKK